MARTITHKTKGKAKERPTNAHLAKTKEKKELVPLVEEVISPIALLMLLVTN
jgi:hypothetical protein